MLKLLQNLPNVDNFVDDIIIFTLTWEQHIEALRSLLQRLKEANLTVKPVKCFIGFASIECLGHMVSESTLKPHQDKVNSILHAERPTTKKQVRSFFNLVGFYRQFIKNFSEHAAPLTELTKKGQRNQDIKWGESQGKSIQSFTKGISEQTNIENGRNFEAIYTPSRCI